MTSCGQQRQVPAPRQRRPFCSFLGAMFLTVKVTCRGLEVRSELYPVWWRALECRPEI
jgi:hypothetical protein